MRYVLRSLDYDPANDPFEDHDRSGIRRIMQTRPTALDSRESLVRTPNGNLVVAR